MLFHNLPALFFMDFWQTKVQEDQYNRLVKDLGIVWEKADYHAQMVESEKKTTERETPDIIRLPLAMTLAPEIQEMLKSTFGRKLGILPPKWAATSEFVDLYESDKDHFLNFVRAFVRPKVVGRT